jgi:hypothetical protein
MCCSVTRRRSALEGRRSTAGSIVAMSISSSASRESRTTSYVHAVHAIGILVRHNDDRRDAT